MAQLVRRRVSASGNGAVAAALQVMGDGVGEDLRSTAVVLVEQIAADGVGINRGGSIVVQHLKIPAYGISGASRSRANLRRGPTIL